MNTRGWFLIGVFVLLGLTYILLFTEWLRPAPIEIASQVRPAIQLPRFTRPVNNKQPGPLGPPGPLGQQPAKVDQLIRTNQTRRLQLAEWGVIDQAPGGVANVTFSLDGNYSLTALRVEDVPTDGAKPKVFWQLAGKSRPVRALLYGRNPEGMKPVKPGAVAEPLTAGAPCRLILEAGRRRGTNYFTTSPAARPAQ